MKLCIKNYKVSVLKVWYFIKLHNNSFLSKNIHAICSTHGTTNISPGTKRPSYHVEHLTWNHVYSKEKYLEIIGSFFFSCAAFLWRRSKSDFSNSLKGKVWIVHCQIKSCSAATQHLTNEIQISVSQSGISSYEPNYGIWREGCAHFLKLKPLLGAVGLMATEGFYFVMFCITAGILGKSVKYSKDTTYSPNDAFYFCTDKQPHRL